MSRGGTTLRSAELGGKYTYRGWGRIKLSIRLGSEWGAGGGLGDKSVSKLGKNFLKKYWKFKLEAEEHSCANICGHRLGRNIAQQNYYNLHFLIKNTSGIIYQTKT